MEAVQELAPDLWTIHHADFSVGGLRIGTRTGIVRRPGGGLVLHSPGPLTVAHYDAIAKLGSVTDILVPSQMHHLFVADALARNPGARVYASPAVRKKEPKLRIDEDLGDQVPAVLADTFAMIPIAGARRCDERVFFHAPTRTLLAVDLAFNLRNTTGFTRLAMWLNDANDKLCMTRLGKAQYLDDHAAAARSVDRVCSEWDFDRLVISHGEVFEHGARQALHAAYAFGRG